MKKSSLRNIRLGLLGLGLLANTAVHAQEYYEDEGASPLGVVIGARGGVVMSTARGIFPSLIISDSAISGDVQGSGEIPQSLAESGLGSRFGIAIMIPVSERFGVDLEFGLLRYAARYKGDATRQPTLLEAQTLQLGLGGEFSIYSDPLSFRTAGLRSVYASAGLDINLATLANRVESTRFTADQPPVAAVGTFDRNGPFNTFASLRGGVGIRFAPDTHLELSTEATYGYALATVFSKDALPDTDFAIDHMGVVFGVGYRF